MDDDSVEDGIDNEDVTDTMMLETKDNSFFENCMDEFNLDADVFTAREMSALKERERAIAERNDSGYYRCKKKHPALYRDLCLVYNKYITRENLEMLHRSWDTQKNEAMNNSVSSLAPKSKTYSLSRSLECRVALAAGIQVCGYLDIWKRIFSRFEIDMDDDLEKFLLRKDQRK